MKTLIVVDMQNDFIDGPLGTNEAVNIVANVKDKIESCRQAGDQIIFTRDTHGKDYLQTQEGKNLPVEHCIRGSRGWQISDKLTVAPADIVVDKISFGHDWSREVRENINFIRGDEIELVGLCTDICVISNALGLKAVYPEKRITVDASCCAGVTPATHKNALGAMKACQVCITGDNDDQN